MAILIGILFFLAGTLIGALYFFLLYSAILRHFSGVTPFRVVPLHLLRLGLALTTLWLIAQQGPMPLLLCLAGFLTARLWALGRFGAI